MKLYATFNTNRGEKFELCSKYIQQRLNQTTMASKNRKTTVHRIKLKFSGTPDRWDGYIQRCCRSCSAAFLLTKFQLSHHKMKKPPPPTNSKHIYNQHGQQIDDSLNTNFAFQIAFRMGYEIRNYEIGAESTRRISHHNRRVRATNNNWRACQAAKTKKVDIKKRRSSNRRTQGQQERTRRDKFSKPTVVARVAIRERAKIPV